MQSIIWFFNKTKILINYFYYSITDLIRTSELKLLLSLIGQSAINISLY